MNARQAAKAAAKRIEELELELYDAEWKNMMYALDVRGLYKVIERMTTGGSPCPDCEDFEECQLKAKGGSGCADFMLKDQAPEPSGADSNGGPAPDQGGGANES